MTDYHRAQVPGGTFFFTLVAYGRRPILATQTSVARLRAVISQVMRERPFTIDAMVILPDHLHAIWTLPANDANYSTRWRLIKYRYSLATQAAAPSATSLLRKREKGVWQRRFWEHAIRDESDLHRHMDYIHYNPVKHGLVARPLDWPYSSLRRAVERGQYDAEWGSGAAAPADIGHMDLE